MQRFEKSFSGLRLDREKDKELWKRGFVYENGEANELFMAYRAGYAACICDINLGEFDNK